MTIIEKSYLRMKIELTSSLSVGSGENANTDHDILVDSMGNPFIPGSAIAGVTRHALVELSQLNEKDEANLFGTVKINRDDSNEAAQNAQIESRIVTNDVRFKKTDVHITNRDMVALDEYKTGKDGAKFDMEALEPGTTATVIIEQNRTSNKEEDFLPKIAAVWQSGRIQFGAKTARGYGAIKASDPEIISFDLTDEKDIREWLEYPEKCKKAWKPVSEMPEVNSNETTLVLHLRQNGGISIRKYTTDPAKPGKTAPDYSQMTYAKGDKKGHPVIPGTSWAGAFRHAVGNQIDEDVLEAYFGKVTPKFKTRSHIMFSESEIVGATSKQFTRCAINRFTGGAAEGALYTEQTYYGGKTDLMITIRGDLSIKERSDESRQERELRERLTAEQELRKQNKDSFLRTLAATLVDLHEGFLAVGGETSIGRGLFRIESMQINKTSIENIESMQPEALYKNLVRALGVSEVQHD